MGSFVYDGAEFGMDDRTLTHVQIIIIRKLRVSEAFTMSWAVSPDLGSGRTSIWLHPSIPLHFKFSGSRVPSINPLWLAELSVSANSSRGLIVTPEHRYNDGTESREVVRHDKSLQLLERIGSDAELRSSAVLAGHGVK